MNRFSTQVKNKIERSIFGLATRIEVLYLSTLNLFSKKSVIAASGPVLSLSSYGPRTSSVYLTIESIGRGSVLPSRLILWLDDKAVFADLPENLLRLRKRGLEILLCENFGPHTKYFPTIENAEVPALLVTADDDILYPRHWLETLVRENLSTPDQVVCFRAHRVALQSGAIMPYRTWEACATTSASFLNFATGVSGVIYPRKIMQFAKDQGRKFQDCCPKQDDIWLHVMALRTQTRIRQIDGRSRHFPMIPSSQETSLMSVNVGGNQNDVGVSKTYLPSDIDVMLHE